MAEGTEPIRQDIDEIRGNMTETIEQIEARVRGTVDTTVEQVRQAFDLRRQVHDHPWAAVGVALAAGYMLGSMGDDDAPHIPMPRPGQPMRYYPEPGQRPEAPASYAGQPRQSLGPTPGYAQAAPSANGGQQPGLGSQVGGVVSRMAEPFNEELSIMASAALRSLMRVLRESLQSSIPQFDTEYQRARSEQSARDALERSRLDPTPFGAERELGAYSPGLGSTAGSAGSPGAADAARLGRSDL